MKNKYNLTEKEFQDSFEYINDTEETQRVICNYCGCEFGWDDSDHENICNRCYLSGEDEDD
jgi:hypothetical protein